MIYETYKNEYKEMQLAEKNRCSIYEGFDGATRSRKKGKINGEEPYKCSFLKYRFENLLGLEKVPNREYVLYSYPNHKSSKLELSDCTVQIGGNCDYLVETGRNYCNKLGKKFMFTKTRNDLANLNMIYEQMSDAAPERNHINIDYDSSSGQLFFVEYSECYMDYDVAFFIPLKFTEKLCEPYRTMLYQFYHVIYENEPFTIPADSMCFECLFEMVNDPSEEYEEQYRNLVNEYQNGKIFKMFCEIEHQSRIPLKSLSNRFSSHLRACRNPLIIPILKSVIDGLRLIKEDSFAYYRYSPLMCEVESLDSYGNDDIMLENVMSFTYGDEEEDFITRFAIENLNNLAYSSNQETLYSRQILTPNSTPLVSSDFPKRFLSWFSEFYSNLKDFYDGNK